MAAKALRLLCLSCGIFSVSVAWCQEALLEKLAQDAQESGADGEGFVESLLAEPIDLNFATTAELQQLPFLSAEQLHAFLQQRRDEIYFSNLDEALVALRVSGDTLTLCQRVFRVSLPARKAPVPWQLAVRSRINRPSTIVNNWQGPPQRIYGRLTAQIGDFRLGLLSERDPGELQLDDYRGYFVEWQHRRENWGMHAVAGDYQIEWAQGLAIWGPYANTIAADVHAAARRWGRGTRAYRSANEQAALRGAAISFSHREVELMIFASRRRLDARLSDEGDAIRYKIDGYHRTATEASQHQTLRESLAGAALTFRPSNHLELGVLHQSSGFDRTWQRADLAADYHGFTGTHNHVTSLKGQWRDPMLAGGFEAARSKSGGQALALFLSRQQSILQWTFSYHHYDTNFHSSHGRSVSDRDQPPQSETGYAIGIRSRPWNTISSEFFYERTAMLWPSSSLPFPPHSVALGASVEIRLRSHTAIQMRYRTGQREFISSNDELPRFSAIYPQTSRSFRVELVHHLGKRWRFRPRMELAWERASEANTEQSFTGNEVRATHSRRVGMSLSLDLIWQPTEEWRLNFRHSAFDTPLAIYEYERDLPGVFTVRALRDLGSRWYIYLQFEPVRQVQLSCKFACIEQERSIFEFDHKYAWGLQLDFTR